MPQNPKNQNTGGRNERDHVRGEKYTRTQNLENPGLDAGEEDGRKRGNELKSSRPVLSSIDYDRNAE